MKKLTLIVAVMSMLAACCGCPSQSKEAKKAIEVANDFKTILHEQELFISKNGSCSGELDKLSKKVVEKYKGNIAIDHTCNMLIRKDNLLLRAIADPMNGYRLYSCGPMGLFLTAEGFTRNCGNIEMPGAPRPAENAAAQTPAAPTAPAKKTAK